MMMKQRDISLDIVRCLACIMVVLMHSPKPNFGISGYVLSTVSLLTAPCIGLFFMVSGALLLPAKDDAKTFLTRRFSKIVYPTIFWSLFYIAVNYLLEGSAFSMTALAQQIFSMPFSTQGHGVMWFMYALAGLYLVTPILTPWIKSASKGQLQFYLALWLITMCYPILKEFLIVNESETGALYYFSGYVGYFVLGYYLKHYQPKISTAASAALLVIPIAVATLCKVAHLQIDFYSLFWYMSIFTVMMCVAWFALISQNKMASKINDRAKSLIISFSNCSFGVYLIHIFIMHNVLWKCELLLKWGGVSQILLTTTLTLTISYVIVLLIARTPFANYIIGYQKRRSPS